MSQWRTFLQIRPIIDKGQPNFLHLRDGDKGPIIFTDKAFLQIRASHAYTLLLMLFRLRSVSLH